MDRLMRVVCCLLAGLACLTGSASAQSADVRPTLITQTVDESHLVTLSGNTRPEAKPKYDRGPVADDLPMEHLFLLLKRSPEQERDLESLIDALHDPSSPVFHQWLTAPDFGERYGVAQQDREAIKNWLESHGLRVNVDYTNGLFIDFSGTAGQIRETFHTEIHNLEVRGVGHIANMSDPQIPAALAPAIVGVVSLHDFLPHARYQPRANYTVSENGLEHYLVVPGDLATIYNLNPLFSAGISGQGRTILLIEDTDVDTLADWTSFRSTFGLASYTAGSITEVHPQPAGGSNCSDPGVNGGDREAIVDAEYASAAAPSAAIMLASCKSTQTFGGLIALQNILNTSFPPPAVVSMSYGMCEASNGASSNAAFNSTFQQAVAQGVSVFVSTGDNGGAFCDRYDEDALFGIGITGWGSSPYDVAVGGTDFGDTFAGTNSTYWRSNNSSTYESAKSYVPEIPWSDSCASSLLAEFYGFAQTYGANGFCNSTQGETNFLNTIGGGGGPSGCATGTPSTSGIVSGTCAGWPKPSYQSLVGNPHDGVRDVPDVSLFAANGIWGHDYPYCFSGTGGVPCTEAPVNWPQAGGTSFTAPIMAGIQTLVDQHANARQGNPNYTYYRLAANQYGTKGDSACNSTLGNKVASSCIFYDVTQGDNDVDCIGTLALGTYDCFLPSGVNGVLSTSNNAYQPAFHATTGWDFATGIGTVNAYNLVVNWPTSSPDFTLSANASALTITQGSQGTSTISISASGGFDGSVTLTASGLPSGVTAAFSPNPATSSSTLTLTASAAAATGTVTVQITGQSGNLKNVTTLSLTVNAPPPDFTLSVSPGTLTIANGGASGNSTVTISPLYGFSSSVTLAISGLPQGVTAAFNPNPATSTSTLTVAASSKATTGTVALTITGTSGSLSHTTTLQLTITQAPNFNLSASPTSLTFMQGSKGASTITISPLNGFNGSVTFSASGLPSGVTAAFNPDPATANSTLTLTASQIAATGTVTVTITGTSGSLTHTATIQLTVNPGPNFTLSTTPGSLTILQASQGKSTITITPVNGFSSNVTLAASGLPQGVTAAFSPNPATSTSTLTLAAGATATTGTATVTITGTSGSLVHTTTLQLTVNPGLTLAASPSTLTLVQGFSGTSTILIAPQPGLVNLSVSGLPSGVTAKFSPNPAVSNSSLTLTASATATKGKVALTIKGTCGGLSATTTLTLTVKELGTFTLSASPSPVTLTRGSSATTTITIVPADGFNQKVTLSVSGLPSGVTASFSTNPTTSTSTLTLKASSSAATGTSIITVVGTYGNLTSELGVALRLQ